MTKRVKRPSQEKNFGSFEFDESANEEALSGQAGLSATGGLVDDLWDDDDAPPPTEAEAAVEAAEDAPEVTSMVEQVVLQSGDASGPSSEPETAVPSETTEVPGEDSPEREAPPVPEGGLPNGWSMDQWKWYGHQWLEQNKES